MWHKHKTRYRKNDFFVHKCDQRAQSDYFILVSIAHFIHIHILSSYIAQVEVFKNQIVTMKGEAIAQ